MLYFSLHPHTFHFKRPARTSRGDLETRQIWFVRAWEEDEPEVFGLGECGPVPGLSIDTKYELRNTNYELRTAHYAQNAQISEALSALEINKHLQPALAFGVETALLDLRAEGQRRIFDTAFSRGQMGLATHGLIWMDSTEGILEQIDKKVAQGHTVIKMKVGALSFADELALLKEVRTRHPNIELRLDANGAFSTVEALSKLERLASLNIAFLEQPVKAGHGAALADICRRSPIPIALDEELIGVQNPLALMETIRPQHLILKPTLLGGFSACEYWMTLCEEIGAQWWINSLLESNVGLNAICQWASSFHDERIHGLGTGQLFTDNIQSPLKLVGNQLWYDRALPWEIGAVGSG